LSFSNQGGVRHVGATYFQYDVLMNVYLPQFTPQAEKLLKALNEQRKSKKQMNLICIQAGLRRHKAQTVPTVACSEFKNASC